MRFLPLLVLCLFAISANAQTSLFTESAAERDALSTRQANLIDRIDAAPTTERHRLATTAAGTVLRQAEAVLFDLFPNHDVVLERDRIEERSANDFSWFGRGEDDRTSAVLVVRNGQITGTIHARGVLFAVRPLTGGLHAVVQQDAGAFPSDHPPGYEAFEEQERERLRERGDTPAPDDSRGGSSVYTVIVPYTAAAASALADIEALIQLAMDETNQSYANSNVALRGAVVHTYQTPTSEISFGTDLPDLQATSEGRFDEVHALRTTYGADVVALLANYGSASGCGLGYLNSDADFAFSVTAWDCATGNYSFGHEIGHNLGARHNPEEDPATNPDAYAHGTLREAQGWRTVMAYNGSSCPGGFCSRLPYWSNPDVSINGTPTGDTSLRDNARLLDENGPVLAGFFGGTSGPIAGISPTSLTVSTPVGESATPSLTISNSGDDVLRWSVAPEFEPDVSWYTFDPGTFDDLESSGTALTPTVRSCSGGSTWTEGFADVTLPFAFRFNGVERTSLRVSVNGYATFGSFDGCSGTQTNLPNAAAPNDLIAVVWSDEVLSSVFPGRIYTETLSDGRFAIQWDRYAVPADNPGEYYLFDSQLILSPDGTIELVYGSSNFQFLVDSGRISALTAGTENTDGTEGVQVPLSTFNSTRGVRFPPEPFVTFSTLEGTVSGGGSEVVNLTTDAALAAGTYTADLLFYTNDPARSSVTVPLNLTVTQSNTLDLTVFLAGAYTGGSPAMRTARPAATGFPLTQPFNQAPWTYDDGGDDTIPGGLDLSDVVDWVLVEYRSGDPASPPMTIEARQAALLLNDGSVVSPADKSSPLPISVGGSRYVVVHHLNHLPVMTASTVGLSGASSLDLTTAGSAYGTAPLAEVASGVWALRSGDANRDGSVLADDFQNVVGPAIGNDTYDPADLNLDGSVLADDFQTYLAPYIGSESQVPAATPSAPNARAGWSVSPPVRPSDVADDR